MLTALMLLFMFICFGFLYIIVQVLLNGI